MILEAKFEENNSQFNADFGEAAADLQKSYDKGIADGKQAEYDAFWDAYQQNGSLTQYRSAFCGSGWTDELFKPKYDIIPTGMTMMFTYTRITDLEQAFNNAGVVFDTSRSTTFAQSCAASNLTVVPTIDIRRSTESAGHMKQMFVNCQRLKTIRKLIIREDGGTTFASNEFYGDYALENLTIEGVIGKNSFSVSSCTKLTHDSLMSIINALQDKTTDTSGTTWKVTLGSTNKAKLTDEELSVARNKGWTVN